MNPDIYIIRQREMGRNPGPWFQSDVQQAPSPHNMASCAYVLHGVQARQLRPSDWEYQVLLLDDDGFCDVTPSIQGLIDEAAA